MERGKQMNRAFIITVKDGLCPNEQIDFWDKIEKTSSIQIQLWPKTPEVLKNNILKRVFPVEKDTFYVFVVACLGETDPYNKNLNKQKTKYLEEIISQIKKDSDVKDVDLENFYLIAHEKDFNDYQSDVFASKLPDDTNTTDYSLLNELITGKKIYLFQHELKTCKIFPHLQKLILFGNENACKDVLEIVRGINQMIKHFQAVDSNSANKYKKQVL